MKIETVPLEELVPYAGNAKEHPQWQIEQIAASIDEFGNNDPIAIDENGVIIEGHGRLLALKELGYDKAEVIRLGHLTDEQKRAYILAHNQLTLNSGFDPEQLARELAAIEEIDMSEFGFDIGELYEDATALEDDGFEPEPPEEPVTKPGDMWLLGRHVLACGDATAPTDVAKAMRGELADLYLTDPPYNVAYEGGTDDRLTIENDDMDAESFRRFLADAFASADSAMRPGAAFYIWHSDSERHSFQGACMATDWQVRQCLIWAKNVFVMGRQDYHWKHEPCLYGWKPGAAHYFTGDRTLSTVVERAGGDLKKLSKDELIRAVEELLAGKRTTVLEFDKPLRSAEHPTMKPLELFGYLIGNSTKPGEVVLDTFGGSGTTLIACEQLDRRCRMLELDPRYCDVIVARWERLTGLKAELAGE